MLKKVNKKIKIPKSATWLVPGMEVKRWFILIFVGFALAILGFAILFDLQPIQFTLDLIKSIASVLPNNLSGVILILLGGLLFFNGWQRTNLSMMNITSDEDRNRLIESIYRKKMLNKGPKIVAIGGGTGLSTLLKGVKRLTNNITAIVTVGDDGGSSGRLREEFGVLPPGDIRNCIAALSDDENLVTKLFQYRFKSGDGLEGHSFGNLFLSALCSITGNMLQAVMESSKVLNIRGRVLPATLDDMRLVAEMEDGRIIKGESSIPDALGKIKRLYCEPEDCKPSDEIIKAIEGADIIILGPGSLYTSVIPNLLVKDISAAIQTSVARKIYICNVMTQPGETDNYSVSDHIKAIVQHSGNRKIVDAVLVNDELPKNLATKYKSYNSLPVKLDEDEVKNLGVEIVSKTLIENNDEGLVRHSPNKLASAIYRWYRNCTKNI